MNYPSLIFGLVGAIGTDLEAVSEALANSLATAGYSTNSIRLSDLMRELKAPYSDLPRRDDPNYYGKAMDAGNDLRKDSGRNEIMGFLAAAKIRAIRDRSGQKQAFVLHSLKRNEEIDLLRQIYGPAFFVISAYAPRASRVDRLSTLLAERQYKNKSTDLREMAEKLILRDESEHDLPYGQNVRKTYPLADLFVRASTLLEIRHSIDRFVSLVFGDLWKTPSRDEQGMMLASVASLRSSSPARQVGAAILDPKGQPISIGCNEVPRAGGGQYWEGDPDDRRDFLYAPKDSSDRMRRNLLSDVLTRLRDLKLLKPDCPTAEELLGEDGDTLLKSAQLFDTIDFVRAVHAEATALLAGGERCEKGDLYVTTFPCHECARHIVQSGIKRVFYVEPYPKSLVSELFPDSIAIDPIENSDPRVQFVPFNGIAPRLYDQLFRASRKKPRKSNDGTIKRWTLSLAFPHLSAAYSEDANRIIETSMLKNYQDQLEQKGILHAHTSKDNE